MPRPLDPGRTTARVAAFLVSLIVLVPTAAAALPLEDFAPYQPQTRCSPTAKQGTLQLAAWLQRKFPGSGSLGIARACGHGGVSEHKEGRAFDWAVNHSSDRDRRYVKQFLAEIFAPDALGNPAAKARRMGIMYLIWNDHIYSAYRGFAKRDYLSSGCRTKKKCSVTLRHRNHVHISLSRAGGRGDTSWYHRNDPRPAPTPEPEPQPQPTPEPLPEPEPAPAPPTEPVLDLSKRDFARVAVLPDGEAVRSGFSLRAGTTYKLTVAGLFTYGRPDEVADATCVWSAHEDAWRPSADATTAGRHGSLDLTVNRASLLGDECHHRGHKYTTTYTPTRTAPLRLQVDNQQPGATGRLVVVVSKRRTDVADALPTYPDLGPAPRVAAAPPRGYGLLGETISVPAASPSGVTTKQELQQGARYRLTVSGVVGLGRGVQSDGQCVAVDADWYPRASLDRRFPEQDHGNLYVDGVAFDGRPTGEGCTSHSYVADYTATRTGRLGLSLWDPLAADDNNGALTVRVQRLTAFSEPTASANARPGRGAAWSQDRDWFEVATSEVQGTRSTMKLRKGEKVQIIVRGVQRSHGVEADAACVRTTSGWVPRDPGLALSQDPLDLWVDGHRVRWRSIGKTDLCSEEEHSYTTRFTAPKNGKLRLAVLDLDHRDNVGVLKVTLLRQR